MQYAIGIDLGGTKVAAAVVDQSGRILGKGHRATQVDRGRDAVLENTVLAVREALGRVPRHIRGRIRAAGVGAPGTVATQSGRVLLAPNLQWRDVPLRALLQERLRMRVYVDNDANCAALGEQWVGAGQGRQHVIMLTLGTGVGAGLILDGEIYRGAGGFAGEVGHITILPDGPICGCGRRGCLETLCSATAVAASARQAVSEGRAQGILAAARRVAQGQVDARAVLAAARRQDPIALTILRDAGAYLGMGLATLVNLFNPELVVIGGSLARAGEALLGPAREELARRALPGPAQQVSILPARLGNQAGMVGAAALAMRLDLRASTGPQRAEAPQEKERE